MSQFALTLRWSGWCMFSPDLLKTVFGHLLLLRGSSCQSMCHVSLSHQPSLSGRAYDVLFVFDSLHVNFDASGLIYFITLLGLGYSLNLRTQCGIFSTIMCLLQPFHFRVVHRRWVKRNEWCQKLTAMSLFVSIKTPHRASLVTQWLRICLLMQGTRVRALVCEDPTCRGAAGPVSHNYWACASGACAPQQERPR